jgi:Gas vesicle synthesis protein GvpL/GvpF
VSRDQRAGGGNRVRTAPPARLASTGADDRSGCYVYGIVPRAAPLPEEPRGVGDPPGRVYLVPHKDTAALVSDIDVSRTLVRPENLVAHQRLLDTVSAGAPVLPLRFGAVLADPEAVAGRLLEPQHDRFCAALTMLTGRAQYLVRGRYVEDTVLREVLAENPEAVWLREEIRGIADGGADRDLRIRLGELVSDAITAKRTADTRVLGDALAPYCVASSVREPVHAEDAVNVALLAEAPSRHRDHRPARAGHPHPACHRLPQR